jgi:hypothetical protein
VIRDAINVMLIVAAADAAVLACALIAGLVLPWVAAITGGGL